MHQRNQVGPKQVFQALFGLGGVGVIGIFAFLIGSITLALISSVIYALLIDAWGEAATTLWRLLLAAVVILLLMVAIVAGILRFWSGRHRPEPRAAEDMPPHRALIAFVSLPPGTSHELAVNHHLNPQRTAGPHLEQLVLFYSEASHDRTRDYRHGLAGRLDRRAVKPERLEDLYNLRTCYQAIQEAIDELLKTPANPPLTVDDIVIEATGGTAIYSAAAALSALDRGVALEYVEPALDPVTGRPDFTNVTIKRVEISWKNALGVHPTPGPGPAPVPPAAVPTSSPPGTGTDEQGALTP